MFNFWTLWVPFGERPCWWVPKRSTNILATTLGITQLLRLRSMLTGAARGKAEGRRCHAERRLSADRPTRRLPERRRLQVDLLVPKAVGGRSGESRGHCERHKPSSRTGSQAATHPKRGMLPHTSDSGPVRKMVRGQPRGTVRIVCNFGRVRELLKSPHSKEPDSGPRNIRKKSGAPRWKGHVEP